MDGRVRHLKAGVKVLRSERRYDSTPIWGGSFDNTPLAGRNLAQSGLIDREVRNVLNGRYYYGAILNRDRVTAAIEAAQRANPVTYSYADLNSADKRGQETIYAGYGLADFQFNALDVVAGVRVEYTEVTNTNWIDDGGQAGFGDTDSHYTNVLPSVTAVYRPSENFVYRGAIWTSFSRPEFSNISRGVSVGRAAPRPGQTLGDIVSISRGNPDLKPAEALNLDLSAEYYPDRSSLVSIGVFHKKIDHFIFTNGSAVDADTQEGSITISQPKNGETARITGVELNLIKSFEGMAAPFDGFGVEANLTRQVSEAETGLDYRRGRSISFIQAPGPGLQRLPDLSEIRRRGAALLSVSGRLHRRPARQRGRQMGPAQQEPGLPFALHLPTRPDDGLRRAEHPERTPLLHHQGREPVLPEGLHGARPQLPDPPRLFLLIARRWRDCWQCVRLRSERCALDLRRHTLDRMGEIQVGSRGSRRDQAAVAVAGCLPI